jgi:hypothetical protein
VIGADDERGFLHGWREGQGWSGKWNGFLRRVRWIVKGSFNP